MYFPSMPRLLSDTSRLRTVSEKLNFFFEVLHLGGNFDDALQRIQALVYMELQNSMTTAMVICLCKI